MNGNNNFTINKKLKVNKFKFKSTNSILKVKTKNESILQNDMKINGEAIWDEKNDELTFSKLSFNNLIIKNGKLNFKNRKGIVNANLTKLSLSNLKSFITQHYYQLNQTLNIDSIIGNHQIKTYFDQLKGGSLNNVNISLDFTFRSDLKKSI